MKKIALNVFDYVGSVISGFDRYPKILSFTYKKKEEFKTIVGGIISIATYVVLLLYAYVMLRIMFEKKNTSKGISLTVNDLMNDLEPITFQSTPFMFSIFNGYDQFDILNDETYINMTVLFTTSVKGVLKSTEIPLEKCEFNHFPQIKSALLKKMNITNYICPKSSNFYLLGNSFAENFTYIDISFTRCSGTDSKGNPCKSQNKIDDFLDGLVLKMAMVNNYYDFDDYSKPIKTFFDDQFYYQFVPGFIKSADIYIMQNSIDQEDNMFRYQPENIEDSFLSIETVYEKFYHESANNEVMSITFYKDQKSYNYERSVFSILDCLGFIGGVNEILEVAGGFIVGFISNKLFLFSLLSSIYQVNIRNDKNSGFYEQIQTNKDNKLFKNENEHSKNTENKNEICSQQDNIKLTEEVKKELASRAIQNIKNRFKYSYSFLDVIYNIFYPLKCIKCFCKKNTNSLHQRYKIFLKGEDQYIKEFDATKFIRMQRKLNLIIKHLINQKNQTLFKFQKCNALNFDTSSSENPSDKSEFNSMPAFISSINSKQVYFESINKSLREDINRMDSDICLRLLQGVYSKSNYVSS